MPSYVTSAIAVLSISRVADITSTRSPLRGIKSRSDRVHTDSVDVTWVVDTCVDIYANTRFLDTRLLEVVVVVIVMVVVLVVVVVVAVTHHSSSRTSRTGPSRSSSEVVKK